MKIPYYKLILFVLLIVGCAREYECDIGTIDDGEFHSIGGPDTYFQSTITVDWPDGENEAKEYCEKAYNESTNDIVSSGTVLNESEPTSYYCRCEKAN